jgi:hypothetical protein
VHAQFPLQHELVCAFPTDFAICIKLEIERIVSKILPSLTFLRKSQIPTVTPHRDGIDPGVKTKIHHKNTLMSWVWIGF